MLKKIFALLVVLTLTLALGDCNVKIEASTKEIFSRGINLEPVAPEPFQYEVLKQEILEYFVEAYTGKNSDGASMYFMLSEKEAYGVLVIVSADEKSYISFEGEFVGDDDSRVLAMTESWSRDWFGFAVAEQVGDRILLDCGKLGAAYLEDAEPGYVFDIIFNAYMTMEDGAPASTILPQMKYPTRLEDGNDGSELIIYKKGDAYVLSLPDEQWEQITDANLCVFVDDGEGYIDLGTDSVCDFDEDGDLLIVFDYYWIALNGQTVCFYQEQADYDEDEDYWYSSGVVPIWFKEEEAELVLVWDTNNPEGYVVGWRNTDSTTELYEIEDSMYFEFLCDYYTYDGEYDGQYSIGDMTVNGEIAVSYEYIGEDTNCWINYMLFDVFNNIYWTEFVVYGD